MNAASASSVHASGSRSQRRLSHGRANPGGTAPPTCSLTLAPFRQEYTRPLSSSRLDGWRPVDCNFDRDEAGLPGWATLTGIDLVDTGASAGQPAVWSHYTAR